MKFLQKMKTSFTRNFRPVREFYVVSLAVICLAVFFTNFPFGQWLSGWDNLHPEFNPWLNISRSFTAVWQENQGVGHLGGHGHAANLLHSLFLGALSLFLPASSLRALFTFLMLFAGGFGTFFLANHFLKSKQVQSKTLYAASFLASVLYLLNFSTVQNFYVQLESFIIFYGLLPWTLLTLFQYLDLPKRKTLLRFGLMSVLLSAIGFIPPLFVAYGIVVGFILLFYWLGKRKQESLKRMFVIGGVLLLTNAYWLLPTAYFTATTSSVYLYSQNNQLSTQDFNLQSISFGGFTDVALMRGFMIASIDSPTEPGQRSFYIMQQWLDHSNNFLVRNVGLLFFVIVLIGVVSTLRRRDSYQRLAVVAIFIFLFAALAQRVFPFSVFDEFLKMIPVINQAFRAGYTKLSVPLALAFCLLFGQGVISILRNSEKLYRKSTLLMVVPLFTALIIFFGYPIFQGQLIYKKLKLDIPQEYFQLFEFFQSQPKDERIAHLPTHWNWGWSLYDWGYTGSGFLWYGIEQPLIDRSFDVWASGNESFYQELSSALYQNGNANQQDQDNRVAEILKKYQVSWILFDQNQVLPGFDRSVMQLDEAKEILGRTPHVKLVKELNDILIYKVDQVPDSFVNAPAQVTAVSTAVKYNRTEPMASLGSYYQATGIEFPFADLSQARALAGISYTNDKVKIERQIAESGTLKIPRVEDQTTVPVSVSFKRENTKAEVTLQTLLPVIQVGNVTQDSNTRQTVTLTLDKDAKAIGLQVGEHTLPLNEAPEQQVGIISLKMSESVTVSVFTDKEVESLSLQDEFKFQPVRTCWMRPDQAVTVEKDSTAHGFTLKAQNASACVNHRIGQLKGIDHRALLVQFESRSNNGGKPDLCVNREGTNTNCLNQDIYTAAISSGNWEKTNQLVDISEEGTYWINLLGRTSDLTSEKRETEYQNLSVQILSSAVSATVSSELWKPLAEAQQLEVQKGQSLTVEAPLVQAKTWQPLSDQGPVGNCEFQKAGTTQQHISGQSIQLSAKNGGVACKSALFPNLSLQDQYLIHLKGTHQEGRGFKFYVLNQGTRRQDLEYLLPPQDFDVTYTTLDWPVYHQSGYSIGLESRSFTAVPTTNTLAELTVIPLPISWLQQIEIKTANAVTQQDNPVTVTQKNKVGTFLYIVEVNSQKDQGIFELAQGYHTGWLALQLNSPKLLPHFLMNGWANGWSIEQGNHTVVILYWPQLLGSFGFLALFIGGVYVAVTHFRQTSKIKTFADLRRSISTVVVGRSN